MSGHPVDHANRRHAQRFEMTLPLELDNGLGLTRDISASGVFFTTARAITAGEHLHCAVRLAAAKEHEAQRLEFEALVVRVECYGRRYGVAACFEALQTALTELENAPGKDGGLLQ